MSTPAGWHPDPTGRHQHRFWSGTDWTDQVADDGATSTDPIAGPAAPGAADAGPAGPATSPFGGAAAPPSAPEATMPGVAPTPPAPTSKKSKLPLLIGVFVLLAVVVAAAFVLLKPDEKGGTGEFAYTVADDEITTHEVTVPAGSAFAVRAETNGDVRVALAIDDPTVDRLVDADVVSDGDSLYSDANYEAAGFFSDLDAYSDLSSELTDTTDEIAEIPEVDGAVLDAVDYDELGNDDDFVSTTFIAPVQMKITILMVSESGDEDVTLQVATAESGEDLSDFDTDDYIELYSDDFYTDFVSDLSSDWDFEYSS